MPEPAPVTAATRPLKSFIATLPSLLPAGSGCGHHRHCPRSRAGGPENTMTASSTLPSFSAR